MRGNVVHCVSDQLLLFLRNLRLRERNRATRSHGIRVGGTNGVTDWPSGRSPARNYCLMIVYRGEMFAVDDRQLDRLAATASATLTWHTGDR